MRNLAELIARDPGRPLLRINVDTHRIPFHHALPQSLQTKRKLKNLSGLGPSKRKLVQNVGSGMQRVRFTHAALICDDVSLQPRLLQILIGIETLFPAATLGGTAGHTAAEHPPVETQVRLGHERIYAGDTQGAVHGAYLS